MNPTSITNAQIHFTKQLLDDFQLKSLKYDQMYVKQILYAQFKQLLHTLIFEIGYVYKLSNFSGDHSVNQCLNNLLEQSQDMAEIKIIQNLIDSDENSFINKILEYQLDDNIKDISHSIFTTVNTEHEIFSELKKLIQSIREMSVQQ